MAEHLEPTTVTAAVVAAGLFNLVELFVESRCLSQNELGGLEEHRYALNCNRSPASRPPGAKRAPLSFPMQMLALQARASSAAPRFGSRLRPNDTVCGRCVRVAGWVVVYGRMLSDWHDLWLCMTVADVMLLAV